MSRRSTSPIKKLKLRRVSKTPERTIYEVVKAPQPLPLEPEIFPAPKKQLPQSPRIYGGLEASASEEDENQEVIKKAKKKKQKKPPKLSLEKFENEIPKESPSSSKSSKNIYGMEESGSDEDQEAITKAKKKEHQRKKEKRPPKLSLEKFENEIYKESPPQALKKKVSSKSSKNIYGMEESASDEDVEVKIPKATMKVKSEVPEIATHLSPRLALKRLKGKIGSYRPSFEYASVTDIPSSSSSIEPQVPSSSVQSEVSSSSTKDSKRSSSLKRYGIEESASEEEIEVNKKDSKISTKKKSRETFEEEPPSLVEEKLRPMEEILDSIIEETTKPLPKTDESKPLNLADPEPSFLVPSIPAYLNKEYITSAAEAVKRRRSKPSPKITSVLERLFGYKDGSPRMVSQDKEASIKSPLSSKLPEPSLKDISKEIKAPASSKSSEPQLSSELQENQPPSSSKLSESELMPPPLLPANSFFNRNVFTQEQLEAFKARRSETYQPIPQDTVAIKLAPKSREFAPMYTEISENDFYRMLPRLPNQN